MTAPRVFAARFSGVCLMCHERIEPGDWIAYDEDKNVICQKCAEDDE
jgi:hypothetical protein